MLPVLVGLAGAGVLADVVLAEVLLLEVLLLEVLLAEVLGASVLRTLPHGSEEVLASGIFFRESL